MFHPGGIVCDSMGSKGGTTDTDFDGDPAEICARRDVRYIIDAANFIFQRHLSSLNMSSPHGQATPLMAANAESNDVDESSESRTPDSAGTDGLITMEKRRTKS